VTCLPNRLVAATQILDRVCWGLTKGLVNFRKPTRTENSKAVSPGPPENVVSETKFSRRIGYFFPDQSLV